ncbi:MAG: hypothetical protein ACREP2_11830 [Rhodanobacteraceae bacterium]
MPESRRIPDESPAAVARRGIRRDAAAAIIASLVGLLALVVAGYTAYIQRQQVRAQVWPWVVAGNNDLDQSIEVYNKGVGPAIVRSAQIFVDGKPQPNWDHVLAALGLPPHHYQQSTINPNVLSPGEKVTIIKFPDKDRWEAFRSAAVTRSAMSLCFCSTLGECWLYSDWHPVGYKASGQLVTPITQCPRLPQAEIFNN